MSFKLTLGRIGIAGSDLFPNEAIAWIVPDTDVVDQSFLGYALEVVDFDALASDAAKGKTLNKKSLGEIELSIPPIPDQLDIVRLLDLIERVFASSRELSEAIRTLRRSAVLSAVGSGDPQDLELLVDLLSRMASRRP